MELTQLKYFLAAANTGRIVQAAEMLHVSQSAVSMAIARLEKELGVALFEKQGRYIRLTENGRDFQRMITPAIAELDFAQKQMQTSARTEPNTVLLAVEIPDMGSILSKLFFDMNHDVRFRQSMDTTEVARNKLLSNSVDFCISYEPFRSPEVETIRLLTEPVLVQLPDSHPLAGEKELSLCRLADTPFVSLAPEYSFRRWTDGMCFMAGFRPEICFEVCDTQSLIMVVSTHMAAALIAKSTHELNVNLAESPSGLSGRVNNIPLTDSFAERNVYVSYHKNRIFSEGAKGFLQFLIQFAQTMEQTKSLFETERLLKEQYSAEHT